MLACLRINEKVVSLAVLFICGVFRMGDPLGVCGTVTFVWSIFHMPLASTDKSNHTTPKIRKAVQNTNKVNNEFLSSQKRLKK